mmetsp:Transcript_53094/g.125422  ORF Transcript_53094/g.125422 Transcript_53094/m.125422 type:complete len:761 (+) Transcript_53094:397-2679(+)
MSGHSDPASSPGAAHRPQHGSWVVLNRDSTWEEIVLDETGNEQVVRRCRVLTDEASASYGRVFDASRLRATCLKFAERRTKLQQRMENVWKSLNEYNDPELLKCHQQSKDGLDKMCQGQIKLFLSGSAAWMKRSLVKALLGFDTDDFPLSDQVLCSYRASMPGSGNEGSFVCLVQFRQDLTESEMADPHLHPAIRTHLQTHGPSFPYKTSDVKELAEVLGHDSSLGGPSHLGHGGSSHGGSSQKRLDESWDDLLESSVGVVDSLEVFLVNSNSALAAGIEIVDGPAIPEAEVVSLALRRQADAIIFIVNTDEPFDWWPVEQALQYLPPNSVFVVPVSDGTQDSPQLLDAKRRATDLGVLATCIHPLPAVMSRRAIPATFLSHLEGALAAYLRGHASSRALELSRQGSRIVQALARQVGIMAALLDCPGRHVRSLRVEWAPKLLQLEDKHRRTLTAVKLQYDRHKHALQALVEEHFRRLADLVPELASQAVASTRGLAGITGAFSRAHKEQYCQTVEAALRAATEGETTRWTVMTLLPTVDQARTAIQQLLGDDASAQASEVDGILSSVWATADAMREASSDIHAAKNLSGVTQGLAVSTRVASYIGVANGCRTVVLPALSGHLLASYAFVFVGAIGGVLTSWLALRTVGQDTEQGLKEFVGEEVAKALRHNAPETSAGVATTCMAPCHDLIERYKVSFASELAALTASIGEASELLSQPAANANRRKKQCEAFKKLLEQVNDHLCTEQFELLQESHSAAV